MATTPPRTRFSYNLGARHRRELVAGIPFMTLSRVANVQVRSSQEVGADHLQAVTARFVRAQHQSCRLDCLLDDRDLALVDLEIDQLRRLLFPSRQFLLHGPPELFSDR